MIVLRVCGDIPVLLLGGLSTGTSVTLPGLTVVEVLVETEPSVLVTVSKTVLVSGGRVLVVRCGWDVVVEEVSSSLSVEVEELGSGLLDVVEDGLGFSVVEEGLGEFVVEDGAGLLVVDEGVGAGAGVEDGVGRGVFPDADVAELDCLLTNSSSLLTTRPSTAPT